MRHLVRVILCLSVACFMFTGCNAKKAPVAIPKAPPKGDGTVERKPLNIGGVPKPPGADDSADPEDSSDQNEVADNQPAPPPTGYVSKGAQRAAGLRVAGGGGSARSSDAGVKAPANNRRLGNSQPPRNTPSNETFDGGGLPNGFYPQPTGGGETFVSTGALPNGFYPQSTGGGGSGASVPPPVKVSLSDKLKRDAISAFTQREEADAFKYLYAHILTSDEMLAKYPIKWYDGLSQPRAAFRWGVGVIYTNKSDDETPLVIGDETGIRESAGRSSGGRGGASGAGGLETVGGAGSANQGSSASSSDYAFVNVENPEGFLLYYTGDFGNRLLTRLESRRTHRDAFYGEILKEITIDYAEEAAQATAPPRQTTQNRRSSRGSNLTASGGGGNRSVRPAGNARGGGGGGGDGDNSESRMQRVSTSTVATAPAADTMGTLIPGVMLVGEGSKDELIERARNLDLDGLLIFKCQVTSGKRSVGMASIRIVNPQAVDRKDQEVFSGRSLKTDTVAEKREDGVDEAKDPVELALDEVFNNMADLKFKATEFPGGMEKSHVENRVTTIVESKPSNKLPAVLEIMSFHKQGFLSDDFAKQALSKLLGGVLGQVLIDGDEEQRFQVLKKYLPAGGSSDDSSFR